MMPSESRTVPEAGRVETTGGPWLTGTLSPPDEPPPQAAGGEHECEQGEGAKTHGKTVVLCLATAAGPVPARDARAGGSRGW